MPYKINKTELAWRRRRDKVRMSEYDKNILKSLYGRSFNYSYSRPKPHEIISRLDEHAEKYTLNASQMIYLSEYMERAYSKTSAFVTLAVLVVYVVLMSVVIINVYAADGNREFLYFMLGGMGIVIVIFGLIVFYLSRNPARPQIDMFLRKEFVAYKIPVKRKIYSGFSGAHRRLYNNVSRRLYNYGYIETKAGMLYVATMEEFSTLLPGEDAVVIVFNEKPEFYPEYISKVCCYGIGALNGELLIQK